MIWVLIILAVLPLIMAGAMFFILRSGRLHRMRRDSCYTTFYIGSESASSDFTSSSSWSTGDGESPFSGGGGDFGGGGASGGWDSGGSDSGGGDSGGGDSGGGGDGGGSGGGD